VYVWQVKGTLADTLEAALGRSLYNRVIKLSERDCVRRGRRIKLVVHQRLRRKYMGKLVSHSAAYALRWKVAGTDRKPKERKEGETPTVTEGRSMKMISWNIDGLQTQSM
jgi:hypothetical protein